MNRLVITLVLVLTACGGGGSDESSPPDAQPDVDTMTSAFAACDEILASDQPMTLAEVDTCVSAYGSFSAECDDGTVAHQLALNSTGGNPWVIREGSPPRQVAVETFDDIERAGCRGT